MYKSRRDDGRPPAKKVPPVPRSLGEKELTPIMASSTRRQYVSLPEAQAILGVSNRTLRRWIAEGRLLAYRLGPRMIRLDADELDRFARPIPTAAATPRGPGSSGPGSKSA
jgi:excisionase family DNA binding protein